MKVSISMYSLASTLRGENWSVSDFIDYAKNISLDGVELLDIYWQNPVNKDEEIQKVVEKLHKTNLEVSAYDITNNFVHQNKTERKAEVEKVVEGIRVAKALDANTVRVFCGDIREGLIYEDCFDWIIEGLKESAKVAEQEKIVLAIENHGLLAGKSQQIQEIIKAVNSPYVKSTFDTGNFLLVHEEPTKAFNVLKTEIAHVHFKDFREKEVHETVKGFRSTEGKELIGVIPGDGKVDLTYIVEGLKKQDYQGWLSIEYEGFEDAKLANEEAVRRLRKLLN
ncbi:MAG: sugar phosphate isomerase/epimerase family protein [Psychrobacillus sp.]